MNKGGCRPRVCRERETPACLGERDWRQQEQEDTWGPGGPDSSHPAGHHYWAVLFQDIPCLPVFVPGTFIT